LILIHNGLQNKKTLNAPLDLREDLSIAASKLVNI
tara:strand:+ start:294 stop:398 length:105 start_codon:yes stop_codon:yes gene_type:complete